MVPVPDSVAVGAVLPTVTTRGADADAVAPVATDWAVAITVRVNAPLSGAVTVRPTRSAEVRVQIPADTVPCDRVTPAGSPLMATDTVCDPSITLGVAAIARAIGVPSDPEALVTERVGGLTAANTSNVTVFGADRVPSSARA